MQTQYKYIMLVYANRTAEQNVNKIKAKEKRINKCCGRISFSLVGLWHNRNHSFIPTYISLSFIIMYYLIPSAMVWTWIIFSASFCLSVSVAGESQYSTYSLLLLTTRSACTIEHNSRRDSYSVPNMETSCTVCSVHTTHIGECRFRQRYECVVCVHFPKLDADNPVTNIR